MQRERGLTLVGLILVLGVSAFFVLMGFKLLPAYIEFFSIKRIIKELGESPELKGATVKDVQAAFERRATIDSITAIRGTDLQIDKQGDGFVLSANWERKIPLVSNVSALVEFEVEN